MSFTIFDMDEYEVVTESRPCSCRGKCTRRCNGMISYGLKRRPSHEIDKIRAAKHLKKEIEALARAFALRIIGGSKS